MDAKERIERAEHELAEAKAALTALDKPELRHGDMRGGHVYLRTKFGTDSGGLVAHSDRLILGYDGTKRIKELKHCGANIFDYWDDLQGLGKELKEFEMDVRYSEKVRVAIRSDEIELGLSGYTRYFSFGEAKRFVTQLRRVIRTAEQN